MKDKPRYLRVILVASTVSVFVCVAARFLYRSNITQYMTSSEYPDIQFIEKSNKCFVAEHASVWSNQNYFAFIGVDSNQLAVILDDPFHKEQYVQSVFFFSTPVQHVIDWVDISMKHVGWIPVRGLLITEETNGGGDWVQVYRRESALVRIHVIGSRKSSLSLIERCKGWRSIYCLQIDLINISWKDFFGEFGGGLLVSRIEEAL
jgi:hypothetical protein